MSEKLFTDSRFDGGIPQMPMVMNVRPENLPDFDRPPLDEVAVAVQFKELSQFLSVHYGLLYEQFRETLPRFEEHQPLPTMFEIFGRSIGPSQSFEFEAKPPLRRVWFVSEDGHQLIQIQPNRFIHNWRKVGGEGDYPRFENILPSFFDGLGKVEKFLSASNLGEIEINQCELSYFNNITKLENETLNDAFSRIFRAWEDKDSGGKFSLSRLERESPRFSITSRVMPLKGDEPIGRLHLDAVPATNAETGAELIRLMLVFRGLPVTTDQAALEKFLLLGREVIVETFTSITTEECHLAWIRKA